jgi:hypothetical protein
MDDHHFAWLMARPHRSSEWLKEKLSEGFDVHHLDGDHGNNAPENLVLIEHVDHMALHGMCGRSLKRLSATRRSGRSRKTYPNMKLGCDAYFKRQRTGDAWKSLGGRPAMLAAKSYAAATGLSWPI